MQPALAKCQRGLQPGEKHTSTYTTGRDATEPAQNSQAANTGSMDCGGRAKRRHRFRFAVYPIRRVDLSPAHYSQSGVAADSATAVHKRGQKLFNCDASVNRDVPEGLPV